MSFNFAAPCQTLSPLVKQYWALDNIMEKGKYHSQRIIPTGLIELTIYLEDKPLALHGGEAVSDPSFLSGQQNMPYDLKVSGHVSVFSITFHPQGAQMFFDIPMDEIIDQTVSLRHLQSDFIDQVEEDLYEAAGFSERVRVMDQFLIKLLHLKQKHTEIPRLMSVISQIDRTRGMISIDSLAKEACLSRKQFERVFKSGVGISPKRFLRIIRLQHAIFRKQTESGVSLTRLAYDCGYYDQSHMINDFKYLTGMSPRKYFSECDPYSDYFLQ